VPEHPPPRPAPDAPIGPGVDRNRDDFKLFDSIRLTENIIGHIADQARRTTEAARAGRVVSGDGGPGVLDLTPLRDLLTEVIDELRKLRPRDRIARALRQVADVIDSQTPIR
jgi:hypothetical protein